MNRLPPEGRPKPPGIAVNLAQVAQAQVAQASLKIGHPSSDRGGASLCTYRLAVAHVVVRADQSDLASSSA